MISYTILTTTAASSTVIIKVVTGSKLQHTSFWSRQSAGKQWPSWCPSCQILTEQHCEQLSHRCLETQRGDGILLPRELWEVLHCCALDLACSPQCQPLGCTAGEHQRLPSPSRLLSINRSHQQIHQHIRNSTTATSLNKQWHWSEFLPINLYFSDVKMIKQSKVLPQLHIVNKFYSYEYKNKIILVLSSKNAMQQNKRVVFKQMHKIPLHLYYFPVGSMLSTARKVNAKTWRAKRKPATGKWKTNSRVLWRMTFWWSRCQQLWHDCLVQLCHTGSDHSTTGCDEVVHHLVRLRVPPAASAAGSLCICISLELWRTDPPGTLDVQLDRCHITTRQN